MYKPYRPVYKTGLIVKQPKWWPASTGTLGNWGVEYAPKALAVSCGDDLTGWWGKTKRTKLEFSGWDLCPYILLHVFVHICTGSTDDCSRVFRYLVAWGRSVHQAWPWNGREVEHDVTAQRWQNGNEEKCDIAMHCTRINEVSSAWGMGVKWKEKHRDSVAVIC